MAKPSGLNASLMALVPRGMRAKLVVGFILMAIAPLFILVGVAVWFPVAADEMWRVVGLLSAAAVLSLGGSVYLVAQVMVPLLRFSRAIRQLAAGDEVEELPARRSKQLGELAVSISQMTARLQASPPATHDSVTGAYTESYMHQRLAEELKRAAMYQRPCAIAVFALPQYEAYGQQHGRAEAERVLKQVVELIRESVTVIDRVGRLRGNGLVVLLPERNKRHAVDLTRLICERVCAHFATAGESTNRFTLIGEVAENPLDGVTAEELLQKAGERLAKAGAGAGVNDDDQGAA